VKGRYVRKATLATTMGPGIPLDPTKTKVTVEDPAGA
jgi:large subunit ribosomal protein L1